MSLGRRTRKACVQLMQSTDYLIINAYWYAGCRRSRRGRHNSVRTYILQSPRAADDRSMRISSLKNFMCHKFLEVKLNPQINFIIGHNGSKYEVFCTLCCALTSCSRWKVCYSYRTRLRIRHQGFCHGTDDPFCFTDR